MMETIDAVWADFRARLKPKTVVKAWSATGRARAKFSIEDLDGGAITILPGTGSARRISKGDFEKVLDYWAQYKAGRVTRVELTNISQNTTYILSLLHWREQ
jgi:hypothetical protein